MYRWFKVLLAIVLAIAVLIAALWTWYSTRDYGAMFSARKGRLIGMEQTLITSTPVSEVFDIRLRSDSGLIAEARMRAPAGGGKFTAVLMAVGVETGKRVIDLLEERDDLVLLAVDYDWNRQFDITTVPRLVDSLRAIRTTTFDSVPRLMLGLEFLAQQPNVDTNHIVIAGVSYGSYAALAAGALEPKASRLVLVQGGGEIGATVAANAKYWGTPLPPWLAAWIGKVLFKPFQPERWIGRISPRELTLVASRTDPSLPVSAVETVFAKAGEPKVLIWHDTPHVGPDAREIIAELSHVVLGRLVSGEPLE